LTFWCAPRMSIHVVMNIYTVVGIVLMLLFLFNHSGIGTSHDENEIKLVWTTQG
jgi:hypothetical protein